MIGQYQRCEVCSEYAWTDKHTCAPQWDWRYFWTDTKAEDWIVGEIYARDEEDAAMKAAASYDTEDYPLTRGGEVTIEVRPTGTDDVTRYAARAESVPHYYVSQQPVPDPAQNGERP